MAKDYAEMLRKAREGYAAATSGDTSGASKSGAKDYAKMLQDARNRVQGIQSNNDADAAQRASNERTVAARYYTNNLQYPGTVKKTPEQQSHDRVVYARQPAVQQQLKNRADMLNIGNAIQTTPRSQSAMSGASMAQSLAQNVPNQYAPADKNALPKSLANVPPKNVEQKGALEYISEKGQEAFYNANQSINQTIEAASQAVFGFFGDVVNNKGVSPEEKLNSGLAKAKERFVDTLERNRAENPPDNTTDVSPEYESARSKPAVKIAGDVNAVMSSMLPRYMVTMGASGLGETAASAAGTLGMATSAAQTFQNAYNEARNDGADENQAALFAARNASTDAIIERFAGGVLEGGAGIADSAIQKYAGNALNNFFRSKPMAKTISYVVAKGIGEGTEEVLQDIAKTEAKRLTYGSDEKLDPKSLAYSGILGFAMGSLFSGMEAPARYSVYKSDYNTVNLLSIGAGEVKSNADADSMEATADAIINAADKAIDELQNTKPSEDVDVKEEISRLNYVKDGAQKVKDTLSENRADIIEQNLAKEDATQNAVDGTPDTIIDDTAKLVNTVADTIEPDKNAVNATIDHVVQEIRNTDVQQNVAQTDVEKQEIAAKRSKLEEIDKTLRNNRKDVEEARKDAKNQSDTPEVGTKKTVSEPIEPTYHEGKGVVQYFVPGRKTPVATSTQSDLDTLKLFGGNTTIKQAYETPLMSGQGVKNVLDAYVSRGYGDVTLHDMFGFDGENQFEANASRNPNAKVVPVDSANASTAEATPTTPTPNAETEKTVETSEKPLTTEQKDATIPVENAAQEQPAAGQGKPQEAPTQETQKPAAESIPATDSRTKRAPNEFTLKHVVKKHSKTGEDLDVYQIPKNLSSNEYARLKKNMVGIGGYYSSFVKGFIVPRDKIDRIEYFADVEEAAPAQKVDETAAPQQSAETVTASQQPVGNVENTASTLQTPEEPQPEQPNQQVVQETTQQVQQDQNKPASTQISDYVLDKLTNNGKITTQELQSIADKAHGGTMAEGKYDVKAMTDAMELGVNRYIIDTISNAQSDFNSPKAEKAVESLDEITESILNAIPTQTKRSEEQVSLQQFSTPPNIAYLASWVANIDNKDTVLEPSAGIGGLASFAKAYGATVYVNELSDSRLEMLKQLSFDGFFKENAEQINNILPDSVSPSVVLMNPPFSSTGGRTKNSTKNAIPHIEQALLRLQDGGRLVAIVGKGMADDTPTFRNWYNELREKYNIRANIGIDGENYKKYGTTFDVQMLVIDKTGPQTGETITGTYKDLHEIPKLLEGIRNDRSRENQQFETGESGRKDVGIHRGADVPKELGVADTIRENVSEHDSGVPLGVSEQGNSSGSGRIVADTENPQHAGIVQTDDGGSGRGGSDTGIRERSTDAKGLHEEVSERGRGDMAVQRGDNAGHDIDSDGSTARRDKPRTRGDERLGRGDVAESAKQYHKAALDSSEDNGTYATYTPEKLNIKGAKPHPTKLVESSAMSSVHAPDLHYVPNLDRDIITKGVLSDAQLEAVMYAGQAHETVLPNGNRKGFLIGDGTGVGKGREISGIILDNFNSGRTKAVWVSVSSGLVNDARRDWVDLGGKESDIIDFSKEKGKKGGIGKFDKGIMFVSYDTLKSGKKGRESNADIIADWFGKDFDGVIVFDEAHKAGNLIAEKTGRGSKKPSQNAIKANDFQNSLKNARVVYASATIADKVSGLAFVSRLGLWGDGTQFSGVDDFVGKIGGSGMAAMELVARDMKATGAYISRNLSYDGVGYERLEHTLTKDQIYMYDTMSEGWQVVMQDVDKAMRITGNKSKNADSQLWSSMMRFYDQVLVSMSMPSVISDIEKQLADGKACVVQVVNTQEAAQERAVEKMREDGSEDYDNLDITPRQILEQYLLNSFPVEQYEKYVDENGNEQSRVARDSNGQPIINKEAAAMRDALLERIKDISIPEGPIDMLINHFGKDRVAEVSGRDRRFVNVTDENGNIKRVEDVRGDGAKNGSRAANDVEAKAFQNGEKDILIFSAQAGGTGYSYHADKRAKNSRQRVGYILQTAPNSQLLMQTIGRIHRSNEAFPPIYKLVSTDLSAQKRFVTSSARRLEQLGALTKGQRQASGGIFSADDNLETDLSSDALLAFFDRLGNGKIPGMDPKKILSKMGYTKYFYDEYGNFKLNKDTGSNVTRFLNRILALGVEDGNRVFDEFMDIRQAYYEAAEEAGTLDTGMENVKADKLDIVQRETVYTDESTGAETQYVQAKVYNKPTVIQTLDDAMAYRPQFQGIRRMEDGSVRAVYRIADQTNSFGIPVKRFRLQGANTAVSNTMSEKNMNAKTEEIPKAEWEAVWKEAVKDVPEYNESELHMITGALLPVWNKLPQDGNIKAMRITATDGTQYLGRVIPQKQIDAVLRSLGASKSSIKKQYTGKELYSAVMDKAQAVSFDGLYGATWTVSRRRVSGENRLEVTGRNLFAFKEKYPGVFTETIQYKQRYFIPTGSKGEEILGKLAERGVRSVGNPEPDDVAYYSKTQGNWGSRSGKDGKLPMPKNISDIYKAAKEIFGIAINSGKVKNGAEGVYNTHANTIRTRVYGDLPTIAHELGHMFDKQYKLSDMESVNELVKNYKTDLEEAGYNESLYPKEAVAMYFADLLRDGEYAQQKNPQFSTALFDAMSDIDKNKLADFKQMTENYFRMDDKERRRAQVRYRYKDKSTMGKAKFQVESFLRDPKGYMGKRSRDFMREVFDDVFELRYFDGAHTLAMRERQSDSIAKGRLEYAFTDNHGKVIGKSLKSVLYEGNITDLNKKDFEAYLIARVALDRLENNEKDPTAAYLVYADKDLGSKEALVNAILDYERENPTFADTANGVYEYRHNLLTVAVDSGIISEKLAKRMEKQLPHYVPLYRYVEDKNNVSPLAKFKGSGRDIYSPIENLATQTAAITKAIQKNETRKALFNAIDTNEDMGLWAEKVPPDKFFDRVSTQEIPDKIMKFLQSGGNGAMTDDDMVEFTEELMKYIGGSVGMWKIKNKQNDKIVSVMRNGVPEYYEMHDPGLVKALENMNPHKSNAFISLMGTATRISSTLVTSVSPRFGLFTNPIRDFYSGYIFSKTTNNPVTYTIDWFKAFIEAIRNTDDFKAYVANGGGYVGCITSKANVLRGIYKDMVKPSSKLKEIINPRNWLESLSGLANAIDSAPRFAEYKRALEQNGGDVIAAVQEGMDVTVNFRQSGRTTKEINNLVMFNSARVTAIGQNSERILKNRIIFAKFLTVNFLKTAMHIAALVLFSKMFDEGDEDTLKDYQNLSTYNKFANWCYPIGDGQFLRVPKEQNVMALSSVLDATWERFVLENPDAFKDMDEYLVDALMVADPNPLKAAGDLISDVTFFGTVLDLAKNETFTGAPIVPNGYQYRAAPEQYNEKTSALAIKLGSITGMSPFQIDYIIDDTTGFVGDVILNLTKQGGTTLKDAVGLKDTSKKSVLKGIPVPGVVLRDSVYSTDVVSNFYDTKEWYDKRSGSYDAVGEAGGKYSFYDTYGSYKYQKIADVYSKANARLKLEKNDEAKRLLRRAMNTFIQSVNDTEKTKMDERISKLAENTGYTVSDIAPYIVVPDSVSGKMPDGVKVSYELDGYDLLDYYTMSQLYFQYYCNDILNSTASDEEKAEALKKVKREVKEDLNDIFFEKLK